MNTSKPDSDARVKSVAFDDDSFRVELMDGRQVSAPLVWYPRLANASAEQRLRWVPCGGGYGMHWEELDEDVSAEVLLRQQAEAEKYLAHVARG
jgi:hypothetical protein